MKAWKTAESYLKAWTHERKVTARMILAYLVENWMMNWRAA
jgi:hypothetical protein